MVFFALLTLVTMGLLASEAFSSRRMNRSLWRDGFFVTVTRERLGIGSTPSEIEGRPANPWRTEVWLHGEEGQLPHSLSFVKACLNLPPPARVHLLDGSLYTHAGPADYRELERLVGVMVDYAAKLAASARRFRAEAFEKATGADAHGRLQALDVLLTHFPASLEADLAAKDALADPSPAVRLRAARAIGDSGFSVAHAIVVDEVVEPSLRVQALQYLAYAMPRRLFVPLVVRALKTNHDDVRAEAAMQSGRRKIGEAVPLILQQLRQASTDQRSRLLDVLGRIGDDRAEGVAMAHLNDEAPHVVKEAVRCLARVGHPNRVVPRLQTWLTTRARPPALKELAEAMVSALGRPIDHRGRLSLVNDDSLGAVSMPQKVGAVAMVDWSTAAIEDRGAS